VEKHKKCGYIPTRHIVLQLMWPVLEASNPFCKHLKISLVVGEDTDPGQERLRFKWRYINV